MSDILEKVSDPNLIHLVEEYKHLSRIPNLSQANSIRLSEILCLAQSNETLDFLINEVEHIIGHEFDYLKMDDIKNSQALLRERVGTYMDRCVCGAQCVSDQSRDPVTV